MRAVRVFSCAALLCLLALPALSFGAENGPNGGKKDDKTEATIVQPVFKPMDTTWLTIGLAAMNLAFLLAIVKISRQLQDNADWSLSDALSDDASQPPQSAQTGQPGQTVQLVQPAPPPPDIQALLQTAIATGVTLRAATVAAAASAGALAKLPDGDPARPAAQNTAQGDELARVTAEAAHNAALLSIDRAVEAQKNAAPRLVASASRLIGFVGMIAMVFMFLGVGNVVIWSLGVSGNMPKLGDFSTYMGLGATLFLPYGFNQFRAAFAPKT